LTLNARDRSHTYLYNYSIGFGAGSAKGTTFWQGFLRPQEEKGTESNLQREI